MLFVSYLLWYLGQRKYGKLLMRSFCGFCSKMRIFKEVKVLLQRNIVGITRFSTHRYNPRRSFDSARKIKKKRKRKEGQKFRAIHIEYFEKKFRFMYKNVSSIPELRSLIKVSGKFLWDTTAFNAGSISALLNFSEVNLSRVEWKQFYFTTQSAMSIRMAFKIMIIVCMYDTVCICIFSSLLLDSSTF